MNNKSSVTALRSDINQMRKVRTLFFTFLWFIAVMLIPYFVFGALFGTFIDVEQSNDSASLMHPSRFAFTLLLSLCSPLIAIPILYKASKQKNWSAFLRFLALYSVNRKVLIYYFFTTMLFWLGAHTLAKYLNLPLEQSILETKSAIDNAYILLLVIVTICFVMPIMEELIFRGWMFAEIAQTKLGNVGALLLTTVFFTMLHGQYNQSSTYLMLFLFGLLLGFMRYKTANLSYAIVAHVLFNSLTISSLFFL